MKYASFDAESVGSRGSRYYPFNNRSDFALAEWFFKYRVSKGGVDDFTRNPRLKCWMQHSCFGNAEEWRAKIHDIPWGIRNDQFTARKIIVGSDIAGVKELEVIVYARDVIMCVRFYWVTVLSRIISPTLRNDITDQIARSEFTMKCIQEIGGGRNSSRCRPVPP